MLFVSLPFDIRTDACYAEYVSMSVNCAAHGVEMLRKLREPVNGLTHLGAAAVAAVGLGGLLYLGRGDLSKQISLLVYGASLVLMFSASATYHLVRVSPDALKIFRKLDHASIYLLIAGTYTPITLRFFDGFWQWGLVAVVWAMALVGIFVKMFVLQAPRWLTVAIYLLMGWLAVVAAPEMLSALPVAALVGLVLGGVLFTVGAVIYATQKPNWFPGKFGFHELWHVFVILGCLCHFAVIAAFVAAPLAATVAG